MKKIFPIKNINTKNETNRQSGFAMLFTVLVISIILSIALGISDLTFKQTILSNIARDSQLAFYQADAGVECGMYYDLHQGQLPYGTTVNGANGNPGAPQQFICGNNTMSLVSTQSRDNYFVYQEDISSNTPCYSVIFDKTDTTTGKYLIKARGFSTCLSTPQQVERGLEVHY